MLEADHLANFEIQNALVDISKYGADKIKGNFSAGAWKDVSAGNGRCTPLRSTAARWR